eukprot:CAMPEP_0201124966 /NCGR_PEP_ID=MMETSP0850-20130426/18470_1 /ASSEMBLY_ACC=CAM_ASM_000622 /TAXON_ID=183588 /ORGANISM="Pseudo-nitzschia fraudulenta, Strain WWA7" /LENGTH=186 /DNA_ID=CAMNT_0047392701 /DNA_START=114 /DNA_END=674 /DNA_ORIENTATION=+
MTTTTSTFHILGAEAKIAHFTMEFIPHFKNGLPYKCKQKEIKIVEDFIGSILAEETGMVEHSVEYLEKMYEPSKESAQRGLAGHMERHHAMKARGFDFTFDCPVQAGSYFCPENDWCRVLCLDETVRPGHEELTQQAATLKEKLHLEAKILEGGPHYVKCLGQTEKLDFHLLVSISEPADGAKAEL